MIPEKATKLLMELSVYNEVEEELLKQNRLKTIQDDWTASMIVMHISWGASTKGVNYWSRIHNQLEDMEQDEIDLDNDVLSVF
jgi:hypothetical protein